MKIDEAGFQAAREHAERIGWLPDDGTEADRQDGYRQLREILSAYLPALPSAEPGRDRIAVVVNRLGLGHGWVLDPTFKGDLSSQAWEDIEAECMESIEHPQSQVEFAGPYARAIIRCNLPRPAEPVEVEGSVEGVGS